MGTTNQHRTNNEGTKIIRKRNRDFKHVLSQKSDRHGDMALGHREDVPHRFSDTIINVLGFLYPAGPVPPGDSVEAALSRPIPTIADGAVPGARWPSGENFSVHREIH